MFCIQCGNVNPDNSVFCGKCGAKFAKEASSPSFMPVEGVPPSGGASSPAGESIPIVQEMPPVSSYPMSQGTQLTPQVAQSGYGMPQNYPPQTYPANDQNRSAEMFGFTQPAFTGQPPSRIDNYQNVSQMPTPPPPPYGYPEAPITPPPVVREPWYKALRKPMPIWAFIGSIVAVVLLLVVL